MDEDKEGSPSLDLIHRRFGYTGVQGLRGLHKVVTDLQEPIVVPRGYNLDQCELGIMVK